MKKKFIKKFNSFRPASALIMTMVLTVLLAIVAVMFVAVARMDRASTSNIADNKMLESAAKSITEIISTDLINDTPGVTHDPNKYYDYPDANNLWLASLEPYQQNPSDFNSFKWHQISDITGYLKDNGFARQNVSVKPLGSKVIKEYPDIIPDRVSDADGDGIADSKWIELGMRSSKGQKIYAAVRVIDNSAMINVNTAYSFDANSPDKNKINGSDQMQINLQSLLKGTDSIVKLHQARCGYEPNGWPNFENNVIWNFNSVPVGRYLPYGISDELELRYRYCIDSKFVSRFEVNLPYTAEGAGTKNYGNLYNSDPGWGLSDWQNRITNINDTRADRRHLLTAYNMDRIIDPNGDSMANINDANANILYSRIRAVIPDGNTAAQIAVNIVDYRDSDDANVTHLNVNGKDFYGFEKPCVYISELVCSQKKVSGIIYKSYAIELFKPYDTADPDPNTSWKIVIDTPAPITVPVNWAPGAQYFVIEWQHLNALLPVVPFFHDFTNGSNVIIFQNGSTISLTRKVDGVDVVVDSRTIPPLGWPTPLFEGDYSRQRDTAQNKCIRRLWETGSVGNGTLTLGGLNGYVDSDPCIVVAHPADTHFNNVGEIGMVFAKAAYYKLGGSTTGVIGYNGLDKDFQVRLNLADSAYQQIFNCLTAWSQSGPNERIKGRININTAPAFVIAQLPWVAHRKGSYDMTLANNIVTYRDNTAKGFKSIGQLMNSNITGMDYYAKDANDLNGPPELDPLGDYKKDYFRKRDIIFARISDLISVRGDIFTAYMLVRIGTDGPQKRYMVILDRSGVTPTNRKVRVIAFQPVADAR